MMALVTHSCIWNRYSAKTFFRLEYSIIVIAVFVDKLQIQESCMHKCLLCINNLGGGGGGGGDT